MTYLGGGATLLIGIAFINANGGNIRMLGV
jgi:hypothetical protein